MADGARSPISNQNAVERENEALLEAALTDPRFGPGERLRNIQLFLRQKDLAHILFLDEIYKSVLETPGYIAEFGVMWGRNLNLFMGMRETYEPLNHTRRILGFDTFAGFPETEAADVGAGPAHAYAAGAYGVSKGYRATLEAHLAAQEAISHLAHLRRFELHEGDVSATLPAYLAANPHAFFALCYFDLDLYRPTRDALEALAERLVKGAVIVFDEALNPVHPGETVAMQEVLGLRRMALKRSPISGWKTYWRVD